MGLALALVLGLFFVACAGDKIASTETPGEDATQTDASGSDIGQTGGASGKIILVGIPIGILTAIFMAHFCPPAIYRPLKGSINLMASIPSIVFGFFTVMVVVPLFRQWLGGTGMTMLTAIVLLGIMILPTIIALSESSIRAVPRAYYQGALALGATHERGVITAVVPAAKSGIVSSSILGVGRAIGETMAVMMVAGNQAIMPTSLFKGARTMTANIVLEMAYAVGLHRRALVGTGAVLFIFILLINSAFNYVNRRAKV